MSFYNTTGLPKPEQHKARKQTRNQEEAILFWAEFARVVDFTPSECWQDCFRERTPITSVRRAITDLTKAGKLVKTATRRPGQFGMPEGVWKVLKAQDQQMRLF